MGRVIINMVTNAGFATNERRMEIGDDSFDAESFMPTVHLSTKRHDESIEIRVRDNGTGIPPDVIDNIFNPFFTTKDPNQGTGLGLALCADIIRQHGGSISVDTGPGEFTEMTIQIPITQPRIAESAPVGV
jgi:signal transduction histidine kinase